MNSKLVTFAIGLFIILTMLMGIAYRFEKKRRFIQEANEIPSGLSMYLIYQGKAHPDQDNVPMCFFICSSLNLGYNYFYPNKNLPQYSKLYLEENIESINQK